MIALAIAVLAFSTITFGQEAKTETTTADKAAKTERSAKRGIGDRKFGRGKISRHGKMRGFALRGLNLTDDQKAKLKSLREASRPGQAVIDEMKAIGKAKRDGTITAEQTERVKTLRDQMRTTRKSARDQIQNILTADQKAQIETRKTEMKQRFEQHKQLRQQKPAATTTEKPKVS